MWETTADSHFHWRKSYNSNRRLSADPVIFNMSRLTECDAVFVRVNGERPDL